MSISIPENFKDLPLLRQDLPLILAPMSGVTDFPFRRCVQRLGGASVVVSEMIASASMIQENRKTLQKSTGEHSMPFAIQLAGRDPYLTAEAAKMAQDKGACFIDLNFGCPAKKIAVNSYSGSALMRDEGLAYEILKAVKKAVSLPVTVKMRKGWDAQSLNAATIGKMAQDLGYQWITVHGRTRCQLYQGEADWEFIGQVRQALDIPVFVNGDITDETSLTQAMEQSQAFGAMIGRGSYGKPWIFKAFRYFLKHKKLMPPPSLEEISAIVQEHFEETLEFYGVDAGVKLFRKHLGWYTRGLENSSQFRKDIMVEVAPKVILEKMKDLFAQAAFAPSF